MTTLPSLVRLSPEPLPLASASAVLPCQLTSFSLTQQTRKRHFFCLCVHSRAEWENEERRAWVSFVVLLRRRRGSSLPFESADRQTAGGQTAKDLLFSLPVETATKFASACERSLLRLPFSFPSFPFLLADNCTASRSEADGKTHRQAQSYTLTPPIFSRSLQTALWSPSFHHTLFLLPAVLGFLFRLFFKTK